MKKLVLILAIIGMVNFAFAIPFNTGTTDGVVSVPGDYATLLSAATAFNGLAGGINANWTLEITADLTEAENVSFGNATNGKTLTIKPQAGQSPTITFTATTAAGIYGHLVFGVKQITADPVEADYFETVNGYVIDGNNGGTPGERNLTLTNTADSATGRVITVFGKTDGFIIKNTNLIQADTAGTSWCIRWGGGSLGTKTNIAADGGTVENCSLVAIANPAGVAISFSPGANTPELAAGYCFNNFQFINNDINAAQRGIFMDSFGNVTISGNNFTLAGRTGYVTSGIYHWDANNFNNYTINIKNNVFDFTTPNVSGGQGIYGILIDSMTTDVDNNGTVNIENNIIKNFTFTGATASDQFYRGIVLSRPRVTYTVEHNSINIPLSTLVTGATANNVAAIFTGTSAATSPILLKNNLIRFAQTGTGIAAINAQGGTITAQGQNITVVGGANYGKIVAVNYASFADWQTAGYDTTASGGQSVDPTTTTPSWDADLKFNQTGLPSPMIGVASSSVLTDIDGEARPATGAVPGADEPVFGPVITPTPPTPTPFQLDAQNWSKYE